MPRANAHDYEPCPACGLRRWKGLRHPVCGRCEMTVLDQAWLDMRQRLVSDNASVEVLTALDKAIIADCRDSLASAAGAPRPYRRRHIAKA